MNAGSRDHSGLWPLRGWFLSSLSGQPGFPKAASHLQGPSPPQMGIVGHPRSQTHIALGDSRGWAGRQVQWRQARNPQEVDMGGMARPDGRDRMGCDPKPG